MVTDQDRELIEFFFRGMCYDMKDSPAYKELSAVNTDTGVFYASNEAKTNQSWYKEFADDFCDFVDDAFKTPGIDLGGDTYAEVPSGDDIDATINIDIDIRLNYPEDTDADALMC